MAPNANGRTPRERLFSRLDIDHGNGCLLWTGTVNRGGYGEVKIANRMRKVHRVMWEMFNGPLPLGLELDHLCRVRHCASPAHLEPVTRQVNTLRGQSPAAVHAAKTHCPAGHEYDLLNTYFDGRSRKCRICTRAAGKRYRDGQRREASDAS